MATREHAAGEVLDGRYRLVTRLGRGGFGDVWRAEELLPDGGPFREVALKLLVAGFADAQDWVEEAKMLGSFRHPSLVTIYATGIFSARGHASDGHDAPLPYVAMELLLGETLADQIKTRKRIPWRRVLAWARDTAAALDVIHARDVVHLDLKPANLYLCSDGALKVLDFGIARRAGGAPPALAAARAVPTRPTIADDATLGTAQFMAANDAFAATQAVDSQGTPLGRTTARAVIGTPGFMAPEVIEAAEPTAAADAYALGVVMVQLATGHFPQECPDEPNAWNDVSAVSQWLTELRAATLQGKLRDLTADPAKLPRGMVALLKRLLAVDPRQRNVRPGHLKELLDEVCERPHGIPSPPYPGLAVYGSDFEGSLFGRDDDVTRLGRELEYEPCVVLQGARRSGKSSLALAGLVPYLAHRAVDGRDDWIAVRVEDEGDPDAALAKALSAVDATLENANASKIAAWSESQRIGIAIVIDPLDALLDKKPCARIASLLQAIVAEKPPGLRVIATLFEARISELLEKPELGPALHASLRFVGPPATAAVRDLVAAPAELAGARIRDLSAVTADVQRELRSEGARLPFVALALGAFWATHTTDSDGKIVLEGSKWKKLGGVSGALARHATDVLAKLTQERRPIAEEILLRLSNSDKELVAWPAGDLFQTFGAAGSDARDAAKSVASELIRQSLLAQRGDEIALAHEALAMSWPELEARRMADLERWVFLERLRDAAVTWHRTGRKDERLWLDKDLGEVTRRKAWFARGLSPTEHEFLAASRRKDRRRSLARVATVGLVLAGAIGIAFAKRAADAGQAEAEAHRLAAEEHAYLSEIAAKSRRTEDPYHRAAYIAEAVDKGSTDGMLPLDLAGTVANLPGAEFLTLDAVSSPAFYWDDRFLIAGGPGPALTIVDFDPREGQVIEVQDLATDPRLLRTLAHPKISTFLPAGAPVVERVPFAFDTSFVTRAASGEVHVWRIRDRGDVALAAIAPMKCAGAVHIAAGAPVIACPTEDGFVRWDLRERDDALERDPFQATFVDVSADGAIVAGIAGKHARFLERIAPSQNRTADFDAEGPIALARWSPRDRLLALVEPGGIEVVDANRPDSPVFRVDSDGAPVAARWDDGGVDLAVCNESGDGSFVYLRSGARDKSDPPPAPSKTPCTPPAHKGQPAPIADARDIPEMRDRDLGPHTIAGGWKLPDGRYLTRDLLLIRHAEPASQAALAFHGKDSAGGQEARDPLGSAAGLERAGEDIAWQIGDEVRIYGVSDGRRVLSRKANLLGHCPDGRIAGWAVDAATYRVFDVKSDTTIGVVAREPGFVLATDTACTALYTQRLDGTIMVAPFAAGAPPRVVARADGYIFDVRPSLARGTQGPGLWVAASSGAIAHIDDRTGEARVVAYASPQASAIGDGPNPGDAIYADSTGVSLIRAGGRIEHLLTGTGGASWEDLATSPDGATVLLAATDKVAILDLELREIVGSMAMDGRGRISPWDDKGSVIAWSFSRIGGASGDVIPRSDDLVKAIAAKVSNLGVDRGRLVLRAK